MSLIANIGIILLNLYILMKLKLEYVNTYIFTKGQYLKFIVLEVTVGVFLINLPIAIRGYTFDLRIVLYAIIMKYLGEKITIPVILLLELISIFFENNVSLPLNYFVVLIIVLTIKWVFERAKKHFSDMGQMLTIFYYQIIITFPFMLLQPVNFKDTLINYFIFISISTVLLIGFYKIITDVKYLAKLANIDNLTNVYNSRKLHQDLGRLSISSADFAVLVIDVDNFKGFNDRYGHLIGDRVLREIADILSDLTRDNYYYYRYGGEEFITIVEKCSDQKALHLAQEILENVRALEMDIADNLKLTVTVSIGIAYRDKDENLRSTFQRADSALYIAKNNGKDQIYLTK
mgnify:CR=1 FL=1